MRAVLLVVESFYAVVHAERDVGCSACDTVYFKSVFALEVLYRFNRLFAVNSVHRALVIAPFFEASL